MTHRIKSLLGPAFPLELVGFVLLILAGLAA